MAYTAPSDAGVVWPTTKRGGRVSTTAVAKKIWCAAAGEGELESSIAKESNWRWNYPTHLVRLAEESAKSPSAALEIASRGLDAIHSSLQYIHPDGSRVALSSISERDAKPTAGATPIYSAVLEGRMSPRDGPDMLYDGRRLREGALVERLRQWHEYGVCTESVPSAVAAIDRVGAAEWEELAERFVFVLLGATSEMGPVLPLLNMGFTVVCVARNGTKLTTMMRKMDKLAGELVVPLSKPLAECGSSPDALFAAAGADLLTQTPELIEWISALFPEKTLVIDSLAYLDGEAGVRVCAAMDAIAMGVLRRRAEGHTALAYLLSPATAYPTDMTSYETRVRRYGERGWLASLMWLSPNHSEPIECQTASGGTMPMPVLNAFITQQGPNYALAKTMQQWRAMLERSRGVLVSANMAPACRTQSVTHSRTLSSAVEGGAYFEPNMAFNPGTASGVLAWLMLYDIISPDSPSNPSTPLEHPFALFWHGAFHGGGWNCGFSAQSIGMPSWVLGRLGYRKRLDDEDDE